MPTDSLPGWTRCLVLFLLHGIRSKGWRLLSKFEFVFPIPRTVFQAPETPWYFSLLTTYSFTPIQKKRKSELQILIHHCQRQFWVLSYFTSVKILFCITIIKSLFIMCSRPPAPKTHCSHYIFKQSLCWAFLMNSAIIKIHLKCSFLGKFNKIPRNRLI